MIKQLNYPGTEFLCNECREAIVNPLCPFCLTTEVEAWLTYYPDLKNQLLYRIKSYINRIYIYSNSITKCIKCNQNTTFLCPYCFTNYVLEELKLINVNNIVLTEFFEFFNFDFDHSGYYKEAEKLGVF